MKLFWLVLKRTLFFLFVFFLLIAGAFYLFKAAKGIFRSEEFLVPDFLGKSITWVLENQPDGIEIEIVEKKESNKVPGDHVLDQRPRPGTKIKKGRTVLLVLSLGIESQKIPSLIGLSLRDAGLILRNQGLITGRISYWYVNSGMEGKILAYYPSSEIPVARGEAVNLLVGAQPPSKIRLPSFVDKPLAQIIPELEQTGLPQPQIDYSYDPLKKDNVVLAQLPLPGQELLVAQGKLGLTVNRLSSSSGTAGFNRTRVEITLPSGLRSHNLRVEQVDSNGSKVIYRGLHEPASVYGQDVQYSGQGYLNLYLDDIFYQRIGLGGER
ncbi:MAG: PASTA domain-containing protein [Candidatus Cloacimonetes bacterium]|nr:PASTA domain-containing protein [Candidatus Cloacimonadota bacterium]